MSHDELLTEALAQVAELRATLAEQREEMSALRSEVRRLQAAQAATPPASDIATAPQTVSGDDAAPQQPGKARRGTSRRGLLRGAATATAAAAVAAVAVGGAEQAHAAPEATGGSLILGQANDANTLTSLGPSASGFNSTIMLQVMSAPAGAGKTGIYSDSVQGMAIYGLDDGLEGGTGVYGVANHGVGVEGYSMSGVALKAGGRGRILQALQYLPGAPTGTLITYASGEQIRDINGELWLCVASGTPGTWVLLSHAQVGYLGGAINYLSKPIRLLDTRVGQPPNSANQQPGTPVTAGSPFTVSVAQVTFNGVSVPASALGAIGNVTVVADQGDGSYLEVVPSGAGFTGAANLAYAPGQTVSNAFNVGLGSGNLDIILGSGSADVIVDLFAFVA